MGVICFSTYVVLMSGVLKKRIGNDVAWLRVEEGRLAAPAIDF